MDATGSPSRERWSEAEAREVLRAWRASGLSMRGFAAQRGLRAQRLAWWRERLDEWERPEPMAKLVPAVIRESASARGGVVVKVEGVVVEAESCEAIPAAWLAALARALQAPR